MNKYLELFSVTAIIAICMWLGKADKWAIDIIVALFVIALLTILYKERKDR